MKERNSSRSEVRALLLKGCTTEQIATKVCISAKSVKWQKVIIYKQAGVKSALQFLAAEIARLNAQIDTLNSQLDILGSTDRYQYGTNKETDILFKGKDL